MTAEELAAKARREWLKGPDMAWHAQLERLETCIADVIREDREAAAKELEDYAVRPWGDDEYPPHREVFDGAIRKAATIVRARNRQDET